MGVMEEEVHGVVDLHDLLMHLVVGDYFLWLSWFLDHWLRQHPIIFDTFGSIVSLGLPELTLLVTQQPLWLPSCLFLAREDSWKMAEYFQEMRYFQHLMLFASLTLLAVLGKGLQQDCQMLNGLKLLACSCLGGMSSLF